MDGAEVTGAPPEQIARRGFSLVPEGRNVFGALTIEENLKVGAGMRADKQEVARDLESVYHEFPMLAERRHAAAGMLSGGQQQMLVIGRALMASPTLLLLDEPSLGLAPRVVAQIFDLLGGLVADDGLTVVLVEQNARSALSIAHRAVVLGLGRVVLDDAADVLAADASLRHAYLGF
jgi:branched-chain amino acid transport system ATP-binding protein